MRWLIIFVGLFLYSYNSLSYNRWILLNSVILQSNVVEQNQTKENIKPEEEFIDSNFVTYKKKLEIAVVIDKRRFFKYISSIMNAVEGYLSQKDIDYDIRLYDIDVNISSIKAKDILYIDNNSSKILTFNEYNKTFYCPLVNKNDLNISYKNVYFGGIDFKNQIKILSQFVMSKADVITSNSFISNKLLKYEKMFNDIDTLYYFPYINYKKLNNKYLFLNIRSSRIAKVLSDITAKNVKTRLSLTTQIGYSSLLISLTQKRDVENLIIANSLLNIPMKLEDNLQNLNSDIRFNYVNYSVLVLLNKMYNELVGGDEFYMNDFDIYIFDNQIDFKTKLFIIKDNSFKELDI